jgi:hypothetical protein
MHLTSFSSLSIQVSNVGVHGSGAATGRQVTAFASTVASHTNIARHTLHVTRYTSHVTRHTSHVTRHTSHVTRHTSHVTLHISYTPCPPQICAFILHAATHRTHRLRKSRRFANVAKRNRRCKQAELCYQRSGIKFLYHHQKITALMRLCRRNLSLIHTA